MISVTMQILNYGDPILNYFFFTLTEKLLFERALRYVVCQYCFKYETIYESVLINFR